jgi:hypothetical protein
VVAGGSKANSETRAWHMAFGQTRTTAMPCQCRCWRLAERTPRTRPYQQRSDGRRGCSQTAPFVAKRPSAPAPAHRPVRASRVCGGDNRIQVGEAEAVARPRERPSQCLIAIMRSATVARAAHPLTPAVAHSRQAQRNREFGSIVAFVEASDREQPSTPARLAHRYRRAASDAGVISHSVLLR